MRPGGARVALLERFAGAGQLGGGRLEVDPRRLGQRQRQLVATDQEVGTDDRAQA